MRNGGMNSFNFHCSPRMVPHLLKPELLFVELSIEKFIHHAKKVKVSPQQPKFRERITAAEASLLEKYFLPSEAMKPSLVAFPHFQTCPSRVHKVMHSSRTGWLIDAMQLLQGLSSSNTGETLGLEFYKSIPCLSSGSAGKHTESGRGLLDPVIPSATDKEMSNSELFPSGPSVPEEYVLDSPDRVLESVVPHPADSPSKKHTIPDSSIQDGCKFYSMGDSQLLVDYKMFGTAVGDSTIACSPPDENCPNENIVYDMVDVEEPKSPVFPAAECDLDIANFDYSPRLTSFIESGFVPESPLSNAGGEVILSHKVEDVVDWQSGANKDDNLVPELITTPEPGAIDMASKVPIISSPQTKEIKPSFRNEMSVGTEGLSKTSRNSLSPSSQIFRSPLQNLTNTSCSQDWQMNSGKKSGSSERPYRLKRLRRIGDFTKERRKRSGNENSIGFSVEGDFGVTNVLPTVKRNTKVKKQVNDARDFIDEEAEVSSDDVVLDSEDEAINEDSDAYEESFIDDQSDPAVGSGQTEDSKLDMMAIYRRSLLTQSPFQEQQLHSDVVTPKSVPSVTRMGESGDRSGKTIQGCLKSPKVLTKNTVESCSNLKPCETIQSSSSNAFVNGASMDSSKRRMVSNKAYILPVKNLEKEFLSNSAVPVKEAPLPYQADGIDAGCASFLDDQFYEGLDLDEIEAQAAKLLSQKTGSSARRRIQEPPPQNTSLMSAPSFDLGI